jgi:cytochrome c-type biogenesis protein CcmF
VLGVLVPVLGYHDFDFMSAVGLAGGFWVILSSLYEPVRRLMNKQALTRGLVGMTIAHIGVGIFAIGISVTQTYKIEKDIALRPGESVELKGYKFNFKTTRTVEGPNYQAVQSEVTITRGDELVATLHPQNRDLFVAMGEDLGDGAWSVRVQYKPLVRFIWLGALVMALGGFIGITDRRYRPRRVTAENPLGSGRVAAAN